MLLSRTASALAAHFWLLDLHTAAIAAAIAGLRCKKVTIAVTKPSDS